MSTNSVMDIQTTEQYDYEMSGVHKYVLIDFFATWCGPCKRIEPDVIKLSEKYQNVKFLKIDIDKFKQYKELFEIRTFPTFILLKNVNGVMVKDSVMVGSKLDNVIDVLQKISLTINVDNETEF